MVNHLSEFLEGVVQPLWPALAGVPLWVWIVVFSLAAGGVMLGWMAVLSLGGTYAERRVAGFIQARLGPNRVGPFGLLQPVADGIKLLVKEDVIPAIAWRFLFILAPVLVMVGAFLPFVALPFAERLVVADMDLALFFILAFEAIEVIGILMAGWAPGSKWSLYGGMRLAAQMLSYEIPLGLCVATIVVLSGSLNLIDIVAWQASPAFGLEHPWIFGWAIFRSPAAFVAFFIFFIGGLASSKRAPFDLPEAESELVAGFHTEYSGLRFAMFFMAEYATMYVVCALATILFLGGWHGPIPRPELPDATLLGMWSDAIAARADAPGFAGGLGVTFSTLMETLTTSEARAIAINQVLGAVNMLLKAFFLYFVMIWVRWTLPRVRVDQVMYLCLKVFLPFSIGCLVWACIQVVLF